MPVYDRWFITPAIEVVPEARAPETRPKYSDTAGVAGYSGTLVEPAAIEGSYAALIETFADVAGWYVVRMYGEGDAGWQALNEIHNKTDTRTLADHATDVAPVLNRHLTGFDRNGTEWADAIKVNL